MSSSDPSSAAVKTGDKNHINNINKEFERDGYVGPLDVISSSEAKFALEEVMAELAEPNSNRFKLHLFIPSLAKIAHHPKLIDAVSQALQTDKILLWSSDINIKPPHSKGYFAPHQDSTYAGLTPPSKCLTAWVALSDPVGMEEGCLSFYPKSHKLGQLPHETAIKDENNDSNDDINNNMLSLGQYISSDCLKENNLGAHSSQQSQHCTIQLRGGQATLHSFYSVHYSGPNKTNHPRIGFALRYISGGDIVRQSKPIKEMVTLISDGGIVKNSDHLTLENFDLEPKLPLLRHPTKEEIQIGYKARDIAMKREEANYFSGIATESSAAENNNENKISYDS
eukprot:CAMPEP_0178896076 /NCGR_PEP_ID=MMETSP0786-20121207/952_1 /TAXON_ID=186022 /ORGANISM="Thalassionema frauenfeldii, Strain CCMP 1798" /LENGTH=338 /DNA_ID=CAMNT_0020566399 /DNA_START=134 /DNA_END=1150 /DNA_ORIENTATION=+